MFTPSESIRGIKFLQGKFDTFLFLSFYKHITCSLYDASLYSEFQIFPSVSCISNKRWIPICVDLISNVCLYYKVQMLCRHLREYVFIRNVIAQNTMQFTVLYLLIEAGNFDKFCIVSKCVNSISDIRISLKKYIRTTWVHAI